MAGKLALRLKMECNVVVGPNYVPTLIDTYRKHANVDRDSVLINITDTNGSQENFFWIESEVRKGDAFVVVFFCC